jgi:hypothetical protein
MAFNFGAFMPSSGGRRVKMSQMLAQMPDPNNGTTLGGLGSVLQKALMGYQMGQEQQGMQDTLSQASQALQGSPEKVIRQPDPMWSGDPGEVIPAQKPDMGKYAQILMSNPDTMDMGYRAQASNVENEMRRKMMEEQRAAQISDMQTQRGWSKEDRAAQQGFQRQMMMDQQAQAERMARLQAGLSAGNRPLEVVPDPANPGKFIYGRPQAGMPAMNPNMPNIPAGFMPRPEGGLMPIPGGPADAKMQAGMAKPLPATVNEAMLGNVANLRRAEEALAASKGNPEATGFWKGAMNALPGDILNRVDPEGTAARAAIARLGAEQVHELSGAAVTASEYPRLRPFIPTAGDDAQTVQTKLMGYQREMQKMLQDQAATYGADQGYRQNPVVQNVLSRGQSPDGQGAVPSDAISMLRQNPNLAGAFDAKYGPGASAAVLGGR